MAYRLTWSPEAVEDVESIAVYIARDSSFYAQSVVNKILEVSRNIQEYPFMGRVVPEFNSVAIRERLVYKGKSGRVASRSLPFPMTLLTVVPSF